MESADQATASAALADTRSADPADRTTPGLIRRILTEPFHATTLKRLAYILLAVPVGLLCIPLSLIGGPAARIQARLANALLGSGIEVRPRHYLRALTHSVLSAPLNLAAFVVSGYFWLVVAINLGYPLRPDNAYKTAWGGPTLAGAWALHAILGGVAFIFVAAWTMRGLTALQARLARGFLGTGCSGLLRTTLLALGVALVSAVFSVPVIHQIR